MEIEFDEAKEAANIAKHGGVSLRDAVRLLTGPHTVEVNDRFEYEEVRLIATGKIAGRLHVCVYVLCGNIYRIISLQQANRREIDGYREGYPR
jgi:uncharacterized DUF497 family protein